MSRNSWLGQIWCIRCSLFKNLGMFIDSDLTMGSQISQTVSSYFAMMWQIHSIRRFVTRPVLLSLVVSLVLTRLDYGRVILASLPHAQLNRLQSVLNSAALLGYSSWKYDPITPLLRELHLLQVPELIDFRLAVTVCRCLHCQGPQYQTAELHRALNRDTGRRMRLFVTGLLIVP